MSSTKRLLGVLLALALAPVSTGCGPTRCAPAAYAATTSGRLIGSCTKVTMSGEEAARVDRMEEEATRPRPHQLGALQKDVCAFWKTQLGRVSPDERGLSEYVQRRRQHECDQSDASDKLGAEAEARDEKARIPMVTLTASEVARGACEDAHRVALEKFAFSVKDAMKLRLDRDGHAHFLSLIDQQIFVATNEPKAFTHADILGGEVHVFLIGAMPVALEMTRRNEPVMLTSPWQANPTSVDRLGGRREARPMNLPHESFHPTLSVNVASRVVETRSGEPLTLRAKGQGCVLLMAFRGH
jgi:hypothetical protein